MTTSIIQGARNNLNFNQTRKLFNQDSCVVCLESLTNVTRCHWAQEKITELACGHLFHDKCTLRSLVENDANGFYRTRCPLCKVTSNLNMARVRAAAQGMNRDEQQNLENPELVQDTIAMAYIGGMTRYAEAYQELQRLYNIKKSILKGAVALGSAVLAHEVATKRIDGMNKPACTLLAIGIAFCVKAYREPLHR